MNLEINNSEKDLLLSSLLKYSYELKTDSKDVRKAILDGKYEQYKKKHNLKIKQVNNIIDKIKNLQEEYNEDEEG